MNPSDTHTLKKEARELLCKMVSTPSVTYSEDKVADLICCHLSEWGVPYERKDNNIFCFQTCFDPSKESLALCAHIDTVPAAQGYSADPFTPENPAMPQAVFGLGSNDDGGSVVSLLSTLRAYLSTNLPFNLMAMITAQEETAGEKGIKSLKDKIEEFKIKHVIVGEPTGMQAATSERGLLVVDGEAHGVSGHAARDEGVNALYIALEDIQALRSHRFEKHSSIMGDVHLAVTQINAGSAHNVVPSLCSFVVDIRPTDAYNNAEIMDELQAICRSSLKARNLRNNSSACKSDSPLLRCVEKMGIPTFSSATTSDWMQLRGIDALKMGPGKSERSHKKDEYLLDAELYEAIDTYIEFIRNYADIME